MPHVTDPGTPAPPLAPRFLPGGAQAVLPEDPYAWMRDRDLPAMRDYLAAERAHYDQQLDAGLHEELAAELIARVAPAGRGRADYDVAIPPAPINRALAAHSSASSYLPRYNSGWIPPNSTRPTSASRPIDSNSCTASR